MLRKRPPTLGEPFSVPLPSAAPRRPHPPQQNDTKLFVLNYTETERLLLYPEDIKAFSESSLVYARLQLAKRQRTAEANSAFSPAAGKDLHVANWGRGGDHRYSDPKHNILTTFPSNNRYFSPNLITHFYTSTDLRISKHASISKRLYDLCRTHWQTEGVSVYRGPTDQSLTHIKTHTNIY